MHVAKLFVILTILLFIHNVVYINCIAEMLFDLLPPDQNHSAVELQRMASPTVEIIHRWFMFQSDSSILAHFSAANINRISFSQVWRCAFLSPFRWFAVWCHLSSSCSFFLAVFLELLLAAAYALPATHSTVLVPCPPNSILLVLHSHSTLASLAMPLVVHCRWHFVQVGRALPNFHRHKRVCQFNGACVHIFHPKGAWKTSINV